MQTDANILKWLQRDPLKCKNTEPTIFYFSSIYLQNPKTLSVDDHTFSDKKNLSKS